MDLQNRMTGVRYGDLLLERATRAALEPGSSSMFTAPAATLDPALFAGEHVRPDVVRAVLETGARFLGARFHDVARWSRWWLAGSGITHRWAADREPRDLDCLIGVDFVLFRAANPRWSTVGDSAIAEMLNAEMHAGLWPTTDHFRLNGSVFELTFYVNAGGTDIRDIHPYAAYDLVTGTWTVPPLDGLAVHLTAPQQTALHAEYAAGREELIAWNKAVAMVATTDGARRNKAVVLEQVGSRCRALLESIHGDRHLAFLTGGRGYADWFNIRWQWQKRSGLVPALKTVADQVDAARTAETERLYAGASVEAQPAQLFVPPLPGDHLRMQHMLTLPQPISPPAF